MKGENQNGSNHDYPDCVRGAFCHRAGHPDSASSHTGEVTRTAKGPVERAGQHSVVTSAPLAWRSAVFQVKTVPLVLSRLRRCTIETDLTSYTSSCDRTLFSIERSSFGVTLTWREALRHQLQKRGPWIETTRSTFAPGSFLKRRRSWRAASTACTTRPARAF